MPRLIGIKNTSSHGLLESAEIFEVDNAQRRAKLTRGSISGTFIISVEDKFLVLDVEGLRMVRDAAIKLLDQRETHEALERNAWCQVFRGDGHRCTRPKDHVEPHLFE